MQEKVHEKDYFGKTIQNLQTYELWQPQKTQRYPVHQH